MTATVLAPLQKLTQRFRTTVEQLSEKNSSLYLKSLQIPWPLGAQTFQDARWACSQMIDFMGRMIAIFDEDGGGDVDFQEFVLGLSAFSAKGHKEEKLKFAFKVYDIDRDGYISNGELFIVLKMMVGSNLKDQQLQQIVDKTIMEADKDGDGKISFEEFTHMVENTDVSMSMTLGELTSSF